MVGLIFAHGRSGSSELFRAVTSLTDVRAGWELFKPANINPSLGLTSIKTSEDFLVYMQYIIDNFDMVKHLWSHTSSDTNCQILEHQAFDGIVYLYRKNLFDYAISMIAAKKTKEWRYVTNMSEVGLIREKDVKSLIESLMEEHRRYSLYLQALNKPQVFVSYEELYGYELPKEFNSREELISQIVQILGRSKEEYNIDKLLCSKFSSANKYKGYEYYQKIFSNFSQIKKIFEIYNNLDVVISK